MGLSILESITECFHPSCCVDGNMVAEEQRESSQTEDILIQTSTNSKKRRTPTRPSSTSEESTTTVIKKHPELDLLLSTNLALYVLSTSLYFHFHVDVWDKIQIHPSFILIAEIVASYLFRFAHRNDAARRFTEEELVESRSKCINELDDLALVDSEDNVSDDSVQEEKHGFEQSPIIRIQDLDLSGHKDAKPIASRSDLIQVHPDNCHIVFDSFMKRAFDAVMDKSERWTPDSNTTKLLANSNHSDDDVFIWSGYFDSGYKSSIPVIKSRAVFQCTPRELVDLIFDSSKVKLYNKMSLGREDMHFFKKGIDTDDGKINGEVKVTRSVNNIPIIKKNFELISLMHGKSLSEEHDGMQGYMIVNRSVWEDANTTPSDTVHAVADPNYIRCECLLGANLIKALDGGKKCEMTTVNHFYTPFVPSFGAKRFGMSAAGNYLRDLQSQFHGKETN